MSPALLLFALAWVSWCLFHSLLISGPPARLLQSLLPRLHRVAYNLLAMVTLFPLLLWEYSADSALLYRWPAHFWPLRWGLFILAVVLVVSAVRAFDMRSFLGIDAFILDQEACEEDAVLCSDGVLAYLRHPWYAAGLILLWLRDQHLYSLVSTVLLNGYLVIGALIEEHRLLQRFGDSYVAYRRRVPMFFPRIPRYKR